MESVHRRRVVRTALLSALGIGSLVLMAALDNVFGPLLFALLLAYILNPVVNWIQRARIPRAPAIGILFLGFYACLVGFVLLTVPALLTQVGNLYRATVGETAFARGHSAQLTPAEQEATLPLDPPVDGKVAYLDEDGDGEYDRGYAMEVLDLFQRWRARVTDRESGKWRREIEQVRDQVVETSTGVVEGTLEALSDAIFTLFGILTAFILIPIYLFYFLLGLGKIRDRLFEMLPGRHRDRIIEILTRIDDAVSAFFRGRLIIMAIKGAATGIILAILGIPFALVLGLITGAGSLIPIAGFLMGIVPAVCIGLVDSGPGLAALVAVIFIAIEVIENYFLGPWILKDRVGLHPVVLILSVFVFGTIFGFVGMLLAVPMGAVVKILYLEFVKPEIDALAAEKPG